MKKIPMIIAVIVSIISAQGVVAQEEMAYTGEIDYNTESQEYAEIEIVDLPMAVQDAVARDFKDFRIAKAYIAKDNTYKIVLKGDDNYTKVVFASANGEWISPNDKS